MKLFLGFLFILLDVKIRMGTAMVGLLPDFIGYFLVMKALEVRRDRWQHGAFGLMLASLVLYGADLVDKGITAQIGFACAGLAGEIVMLAMLCHVVRRMNRLRELFPVLACIRVLVCLLGWIPLVGSVCTVAGVVMSVCFLAAAYQPLVRGGKL